MEKTFIKKNGLVCEIVDIAGINRADKYNFYIENGFIYEKNNNKATAMPIELNLFNSFLLSMPTTAGSQKAHIWIEALLKHKQKHGSPDYVWASAQRILSEMGGFFLSCPLLGVEVTFEKRAVENGVPIYLSPSYDFRTDERNEHWQYVFYRKTKHVWVMDKAQTTFGGY
jgi:hypothetical protein